MGEVATVTTLTRAEAAQRAVLLSVQSYDVHLDLTRGPEVFGSTSTIHFTCVEPGQQTFVDLMAPLVRSVTLNGRELARGDERIALDDLLADNVLTVDADCAYSRTGEGLHRFTDPADGEVYTYSQTFLADAQRVFACFDQPDLKAPLTLRVTAPPAWTVLSNGAGAHTAPGEWEFATTPPLATYFMAVVAGPYHSQTRQHGDLTLGVHCRQSLAAYLDADELFEITGQCFDFYHRTFAVPYAFGPTYDQVFVPEFNAGAMENAGCVTFRDEMLFRSQATESARLQRAMVIAHKMAHMWFGDLVTLRWWDDIWLNESFATYMGYRTTAEATRFATAWTAFATTEKAWGYRQDQQPTTHPVSTEVTDTATALLNFDGISYAKGASVLKQLVAYVGFDAFVAGVRDYFNHHAYGNTSLTDLLAALEATSGRDLTSWSRLWLQTAGIDTLRAVTTVDNDGRYVTASLHQSAPADHPELRPHRVAVGLYHRDGEQLVRRERLEVDVVGADTALTEVVGLPVADLLLVNDDDLTWAKVRLEQRSLQAVLDGAIPRIADSLPRALLWASLWDMTRDAELPAGDYLRVVLDGAGAETDVGVVERLLLQARQAVDSYGDPLRRDERLALLAARCREWADGAPAGGDLQLVAARAYTAATTDVTTLAGWLAGAGIPPGLAVDRDLRWRIVTRLAALGACGEDDIAAEYARDTTSAGEQAAATARASRPTAEAKVAAWSALLESTTLSNHLVTATAAGFWQRGQEEHCWPFAERYFTELPGVWRDRTAQIADTLTRLLFPAVLVEAATVALADRALAEGDLDPGWRRGLLENRADLQRALAAQERDAGG